LNTGLPLTAIEIGIAILLTATFLTLLVAFLTIFGIRKEIIKLNLGVGYLQRLLTVAADKRRISLGYYDFRVDEWKEDTKFVVLAMLQKGVSDNEIPNVIDVSQAYINQIRRWAINEGILFKKVLK
jgi:hypothetical protein